MSVIDIQRSTRRVGEIRFGAKSDKGYPMSLDTFRFTSETRRFVEDAAIVWGGTVAKWGDKWEVVTEAPEILVAVPRQDPERMTWYELWSAGGLKKRCDGVNIQNSDNLVPCNCNPEHRECSPITRISFLLPDTTGVNGQWLMSSTGFYAAVELPGVIAEMQNYSEGRSGAPEALLGISHRTKEVAGKPRKEYTVPTLTFTGGFYPKPQPEPPAGLPSDPAFLAAETDGPTDQGGGSPSAPALVEPPLEPEFTGDVDEETEHWSALMDTLNEDPTEGNMEAVEERLRRLYRLMRTVGLWPDGTDGRDALHWQLSKNHQAEHVGDLKRAELARFIKTSYMHAEGKVKAGE